jgi:hypothetical protein
MIPLVRLIAPWAAVLAASLSAPGLTLDLQTREPATGAITLRTEEVDPRRVGVIAVDVGNVHWCKTATMRVDAFVPQMNRALDAARERGMTVMLCPSDVVDNGVSFPQREAVPALPPVPVTTPTKPVRGPFNRPVPAAVPS